MTSSATESSTSAEESPAPSAFVLSCGACDVQLVVKGTADDVEQLAAEHLQRGKHWVDMPASVCDDDRRYWQPQVTPASQAEVENAWAVEPGSFASTVATAYAAWDDLDFSEGEAWSERFRAAQDGMAAADPNGFERWLSRASVTPPYPVTQAEADAQLVTAWEAARAAAATSRAVERHDSEDGVDGVNSQDVDEQDVDEYGTT